MIDEEYTAFTKQLEAMREPDEKWWMDSAMVCDGCGDEARYWYDCRPMCVNCLLDALDQDHVVQVIPGEIDEIYQYKGEKYDDYADVIQELEADGVVAELERE